MGRILPRFSKIIPETSEDRSTRSFSIMDKNGFKCMLPAISDGSVKTIALLVGILSHKHSSVIIEEPENYLHPWACQSLIEYLRDYFSEGVCILTSHSETILNSIQPKEIIVCENINGLTKCSRLINIRSLQKVISSSGLGCGYQYVSGSIGGVPE